MNKLHKKDKTLKKLRKKRIMTNIKKASYLSNKSSTPVTDVYAILRSYFVRRNKMATLTIDIYMKESDYTDNKGIFDTIIIDVPVSEFDNLFGDSIINNLTALSQNDKMITKDFIYDVIMKYVKTTDEFNGFIDE